ncbi:MAG: hypothetical protein AB1480_05260 [Nitrospirota bacterium]
MRKEKGDSSAIKLSRPFTFVDTCNKEDSLFQEIMQEDLKGKNTPLELMHYYADILNKRTSHGEIAEKLDKLFLCGRTPHNLDGFYHGITISLKTGTDIYSALSETLEKLGIGKEFDILHALYSSVLFRTSPWAGKDFKRIGPEKIRELTEGFDIGRDTAYLGINSFRKDNKGFVNNLSNYILSTIINMEAVPKPKENQRSWIHARGGLFIAKKDMSVDIKHPEKEVMALNYRWRSLGNKFPNKLLIDEIVEIAEGLYLGKLYYATAIKYLFKDYDPEVLKEDYHYRNFGYFLLMDDTWLDEKNRLFPDLAYNLTCNLSDKFRTFRFKDSPECRAIQDSIGDQMTILHYLRDIYEGIQKTPEHKDKFFEKLHNIFNCGERPDGINGFLHGGVVSFNNGGFLKKFDRNVLNDIYPAVRPFSPWTGKTFTLSSVEGIRKYIGNSARYYEGIDPIIIGSNTYRKELGLSLPTTVFIEHLDKIGMVVGYPDEWEKNEDIYVKSFYFIATNSKSINPENKGKDVLQFNYRWPEFHTMPPDHLCIDELVRIADGLYLGQLLYSTKPGIKYDPEKDPSVYEYENFGYFMLMDDEWHAIKEFIAFDV